MISLWNDDNNRPNPNLFHHLPVLYIHHTKYSHLASIEPLRQQQPILHYCRRPKSMKNSGVAVLTKWPRTPKWPRRRNSVAVLTLALQTGDAQWITNNKMSSFSSTAPHSSVLTLSQTQTTTRVRQTSKLFKDIFWEVFDERMKEQEIGQQMYIHLQDEQFVGWLKKKKAWYTSLGGVEKHKVFPRGNTMRRGREVLHQEALSEWSCATRHRHHTKAQRIAGAAKKAQAANFTFFSQQSDTPLAEQLAAAMNNHNSNIFNNTYSSLGEIRLERESSTTDEIFDVDSDDDVQSLETPPKKQKTTVNEIDDIVEPQHVGQFVNKLMSYDDANRTRAVTAEFNPTWTHRRIAEIIRNELRLRVSESYIGRLRREMIKLRRKRLTHVAKQRSSVRVQYVGKLLPIMRKFIVAMTLFNYFLTEEYRIYSSPYSPTGLTTTRLNFYSHGWNET